MNIKKAQHTFLEDFGAKKELLERVVYSENDLAAAELKGYTQGYELGKTEAKHDLEVIALEQIDIKIKSLITIAEQNLSKIDIITDEMAQVSVQLATVFSKTFAKHLYEKYPYETIEQLAAECFRHMRNTTNFVFRVAPDLVEPIQAILQKRADHFGYTGRIIILADQQMLIGDVEIEWADGGYEHKLAKIESSIQDCIKNWLCSNPNLTDQLINNTET